MTGAAAIARMLAERVDQLVADLLPGGHREGQEWRCGSVAGEPGNSLGVHLTGVKRGLWADFAAGGSGDALDLVQAVLGLGMVAALRWSSDWLGLTGDDDHDRPAAPPAVAIQPPGKSSDLWRRPWLSARPIVGTLAEAYLGNRGSRFDDATGRVLRFAQQHPRRSPAGHLERHPALLCLLSDIRTGEPCGTVNVYLQANGSDRIRDRKGKTSWGRASGSAVMLSAFDEPSLGLTLCEGVETGIALLMAGIAPVWCCGGAANLASFPILAGIEALTVAADADAPGQRAAETAAQRWRAAGRKVVVIAPPGGDWADRRRENAA